MVHSARLVLFQLDDESEPTCNLLALEAKIKELSESLAREDERVRRMPIGA